MQTSRERGISSLERISPESVIEEYLTENSLNDQLIKDRLDPETRVSVVIPTYNETGVITRCLQALNEQSYRAFEVIVVDNGSIDGTVREINDFREQANYPLYVVEESTPGVAVARKKGMDEVLRRVLERRNGEYHHILVVTDADTIPPKEWLEKITRGFNHHLIGGLAGTHEASKEIEEKIYETMGIRNYFNIIPSLIELFEERGIGRIKMSGPNSAFTATSYALGGGIKHEIDSNGNPKLNETNNLGDRIRQCGYRLVPLGCRVIKNRRRELYEILTNCKDSYFPEGFSSSGRFNVIRKDELELLNVACRNVPKETWENYRHKMIYKVIINFIIRPLTLGEIKRSDTQEIFTPEEIQFFLSNHSFLPNDQYLPKVIGNFLFRLETMLSL